MNTSYNPLFRATRAAWCELTTAEARRWYWQQIQTSAILAQKITLQGVTIAQRWISARSGQVAVELVQEHDVMATEPAAVNATAATTASELGDIPTGWAAIEATDTPTATLSEQTIAVAESSAAAAELEPESLDLAATEQTTATDYEMLDESQELPTETDEPLVDAEIPFSDELECGPPSLTEEDDDSFFDPETEDESDSLLENDLEPVASVLPPDLSKRVEAYLKSHGISAEPERSHSHTPATSYSSFGAEFGE